MLQATLLFQNVTEPDTGPIATLLPAFLSQNSEDIRVRSLEGNSFIGKFGDHRSWCAQTAVPVCTCCPRVTVNNTPSGERDHPGVHNKLCGFPREEETERDVVTAHS